MHPYLWIQLFACVASAALASTIVTRDPRHLANRLATGLVSGSLWWALCEIAWNGAPDAETALWWVKTSALGWVAIGPLGLHLFLEVTGEPAPLLRRRLPWLYACSVLFLAVDWSTDWIHTGVVRTSWGWAYELGPFYLFFYVFTVSGLGAALQLGVRAYRESPSPGERSQARWIAVGIAVPLVVASLTDGLLPLVGVQPPRLGTAAFAFLGLTIAWSFHRYGYSLLAPGAFAREILETLPDGVALLRLDGRLRTANGGLSRLAGRRSAAELAGMPVCELLPAAPIDPPREVAQLECELLVADGRPIPVSLASSLLRDKQGSAIGLVVVVRDLREVVALRNRLVTSGRLAAVGELAAGIAHEINNPIAFVRANLSLLRQHWADLSAVLRGGDGDGGKKLDSVIAEGEELLDESIEGVERAAGIVRDVKGFAHAGRGQRELTDLSGLLDGVLRIAAPQLRGRATIERRYGDVPHVPCAPQALKQVFLNLVLNAAQALADGGRISLATALDGGEVVVSVEDDGCGMPPEVLERVFDPFFTTKPVGEGTGLGLAISYQLVRNHGGEIEIDSRPGAGTTVRVRLPVG